MTTRDQPFIVMSAYGIRVALVAIGLLLATLAAVSFAPRLEEVAVLDSAPNGDQVPTDSAIRVTFSRPVDQISAERVFVLYPPARGRFAWEDARTLIFTPYQPLQSNTLYRVVIRRGLSDTRGYTNQTETSWPFRTGE